MTDINSQSPTPEGAVQTRQSAPRWVEQLSSEKREQWWRAYNDFVNEGKSHSDAVRLATTSVPGLKIAEEEARDAL